MSQLDMDIDEAKEEAMQFLDDADDLIEECEVPEEFAKGYEDCKRFDIKGLKGRSQYVIVDDQGIMVTFPDNKEENWQYQATATALTRIISVAQQAGICMEGIKKQLAESSMQKGDTPAILLEAIEKYEHQK